MGSASKVKPCLVYLFIRCPVLAWLGEFLQTQAGLSLLGKQYQGVHPGGAGKTEVEHKARPDEGGGLPGEGPWDVLKNFHYKLPWSLAFCPNLLSSLDKRTNAHWILEGLEFQN